MVIALVWSTILAVDSIPFFPINKRDKEGCNYVPYHSWNIGVIVCFNVVPFVIIMTNYTAVWMVAAKAAKRDSFLRKHVRSSPHQVFCNKENLDSIETETVMYDHSADSSKQELLNTDISIKLFNPEYTNNRKKSYKAAMKDSESDFTPIKPKRKDNTTITTLTSATITKKENSTLPGKRRWIGEDAKKRLEVPYKVRILWEMKATKTSAVLLLVYLICWAPLGSYYFIQNLCPSWIAGVRHDHPYTDRVVLKVLSLFSSIFLPLVYCWKTNLFRKEVRQVAKRQTEWMRRKRHHTRVMTLASIAVPHFMLAK